jgi:hypothetical protein
MGNIFHRAGIGKQQRQTDSTNNGCIENIEMNADRANDPITLTGNFTGRTRFNSLINNFYKKMF